MLEAIRIVKEKDQSWKLVFNGRDYHISTSDSGIMDILKRELQVSQEQCPKIFQDYDIAPEFYINYSPEWL